MAHTPGPWKVANKFEVGPVSRNDDQSNGMVTPVADVFGDNREDDARLIAAAPNLLKALTDMVKWHGRRAPDTDALLPPDEQEQEVGEAMRVIANAAGAE